MKSWFLHHRWYEHWTAHQECLPISLLSDYNELCHVSTVQHLLSLDSKLMSAFVLSRLDNCNSLLSGCPKHLTEELQKVQNPAARLVLKAHKRDQVSPFLRTLHCPPKHLSNIRCQHPVTPFSLIQPLFICLAFFMSTLHQNSSAPPLIQELYAFCTWRPKHLDIAPFLMLLLLSGILYYSVNHCI